MDHEQYATAPDWEQEQSLITEESLALCEAAQIVLEEYPAQAKMLHSCYYGEKGGEQALLSLSVSYPNEVACGLVGYWQFVLSAAAMYSDTSAVETPLEILRRRNARVLQGPMADLVEESCNSRLSLYEVQDLDGPRIQILDLIAKGAEPLWVDTYASQISFDRWDIHGMRILGMGRRFRASHAMHFFTREHGLALARHLRWVVKENARRSSPLPWGFAVDFPIVHAWMEMIQGGELKEDPQPVYEAELLDREDGKALLKRRMLAWIGEPNELLDGRTPAEAAGMAKERVKVVNMLKSFENQESLRVDDTEEEPFSFRFLWEKLGLNPSMPSLEEV